jgi:hypothetical protein
VADVLADMLAGVVGLLGRTQFTSLLAVQTCQQYVTEVIERSAGADELAFRLWHAVRARTVRSKSSAAMSLHARTAWP